MKKLSPETLMLLRALIDVVQPEALRFIELTVQGTVQGALCHTPVTDRPDVPLLPLVSGGGHLLWEPQLTGAHIPCPRWFVHFESHPLRLQLAAALRAELPVVSDEFSQFLLTHSAPHAIDLYIDLTVRIYLSLLVSLSQHNRESAFQLALEQLEIRLDPERAESYAGCFLYNFLLDDPNVGSVDLADDIVIRKSTFSDVTRRAFYDALDGNFLPPPYILTYRIEAQPLSNILGIAHGDVSHATEIDTVIAVLRLRRSNYLGRGSVHSWTEGLPSFLGRPAPPPPEANITMFMRGDDPPPAHPFPKYQLGATEVGEVRRLLECVRRLTQSDAKVANAIRLLGTRENDWVNLYKVHEIVKGDVGGRIISDGWATEKRVKLFTRTANTVKAIGDDARHADESFQPPPTPMTLPEAQSLIGEIVTKWVESKC